MTIDLLERGAKALGPLGEQVVFVGGATITLWVTDPGAPPPRPTKDVDIVIEVTTPNAFHDFQDQMRRRGFREDIDSGVICRWRFRADDDEDELVLDAMPAAGGLLGFENPWQSTALPHAVRRALPSGATIRAITPPCLVATKLAAFAGRGNNDHRGSHDLEDIIMLTDGREELVAEIAAAPANVRAFVGEQVAALLHQRRFVDAIYGFLPGDDASQARAETIVLPRLRAMAMPKLSGDGSPLVDVYGTPWGDILADADVLNPVDAPAIEIHDGIPDAGSSEERTDTDDGLAQR